MKRVVAVFMGVMLLAFGLGTPASAEPTGTVSGTVTLDGDPLEGVEVFLGIFPGPSNPDFEARYTCTDAGGYFEFADVPLDHGLISATGPEVGRSLHVPVGPCDNPKFFDPTSNPARPLMASYWEGGTAPGSFTVFSAPMTDLDYEVIRLPNDHPGINNHARQAMNFCYDMGKPAQATKKLDKYDEAVDVAESEGTLDPGTIQLLRDHGETIRGLFEDPNLGCPPFG